MDQINKQLELMAIGALFWMSDLQFVKWKPCLQGKFFQTYRKEMEWVCEYRTKYPPDLAILAKSTPPKTITKILADPYECERHASNIETVVKNLADRWILIQANDAVITQNVSGLEYIVNLMRSSKKKSVIDIQALANKYGELLENVRNNGRHFYDCHLEQPGDRRLFLTNKKVMTVVGPTGRGKSSLMIYMAYHMAKDGNKVVYITNEMADEEIFEKMLSTVSKIDSLDLFKGRLNDDDYERVKREIRDMSETLKEKIWIIEKPRFDMHDIIETITTNQPNVVFVDYVQRFDTSEYASEAQGLSEIVNAVKCTAMDSNVALVVGSQVRRSNDGKERKATGLTIDDVKGSGGIAEASDIVVIINPYESGEMVDQIDLRIVKNRRGRCGVIPLIFDKRICSFTHDVERSQEIFDSPLTNKK